MLSAARSLQAQAGAARAAVLSGLGSVVLSLGNEAGDLDSVVSSLALAFLRDGGPDGPACALIPYPRRDWGLRRDTQLAFRALGGAAAGAAPGWLLFSDEADPAALRRAGRLRSVLLADHNSSPLPWAAGIVHAIVDHHADEGRHPEARLRVIDAACGSASSIAAELVLQSPGGMPADLAQLLAAAVLLDTRNFDPRLQRYSPRDRAALSKLEPLAGLGVGPAERAARFGGLLRARYDTSGLSVADLLRLDCKVCETAYGTVAIPAVSDTLHATLERAGSAEGLLSDLRSFLAARSLSLLLVLTAEDRQRRSRGLVVYPPPWESAAADAAVRGLREAAAALPERLLRLATFERQSIRSKGFGVTPQPGVPRQLAAFRLHTPVTRKTLQPAVLEILSKPRRVARL